MFQKTIKTLFISLISIILIHYLYIFLKTNLTIPKVKDLIHKPNIQYQEIYKVINKKQDVEQSNMKNELKEYLQSLSNTKTNLPFENLQSGQSLNQSQLMEQGSSLNF